LQHLALARDAQLVVFDDRGAGNGMVLPAGPLREPLGAAVRPNTAVLYNAAQRTTHLPGSVVQRSLAGAVPLARWWRGEPAKPEGLAALAGHPLTAAAGIAAPQRFFAMLEAAGLTFKRMPLPDHHPLDPRPWTGQDGNVIVTEKDAVKLAPDAPDAHRIHVATLDFNLPAETVDALHGWLVARTQR
jgi:tetraacyldisaccharide 4'-kinase